jgi:peptidoglycan/LPS O-acetylase OafA/YrhL
MDKTTSQNIQALRLYFALLVVISHISYLFVPDSYWFWSPVAYLAVCGFFVISGMVNYLSLTNNSNPIYFFKKRIKRLFPLYYSVLILSLIFEFSIRDLEFNHLGHFLFFQHIFTPTLTSNPVFWTLSYEMWLYICLVQFVNPYYKKLYPLTFLAIFSLWTPTYYLHWPSMGVIVSFLFGVLIQHQKINFTWLKLPLHQLGKYSYELYLIHYPLLYICFLLFGL